ncbi:uncharacterized protein TNCV_3820431 [Trichonephila clavipes]|nr:uncharacterized protein TNCV_3820431 [Trichonephila clavipes]
MADRRVFMLGSRSLLLDKRRQACRRSFEAGILTSRKVYSEESEWKSESSYWLMKSEDNGSGKMAAHVGGEWCSDGCPGERSQAKKLDKDFMQAVCMHVGQWCVFVDSKTLCGLKWTVEHRDWSRELFMDQS